MGIFKPEHEYSTKLTDEQFAHCWEVAEVFLKKTASIRNRQLREISGIGYDQAIDFFNRAVDEKRVVRLGSGSGTHYVLKTGEQKAMR
jgi:hypothetical protein